MDTANDRYSSGEFAGMLGLPEELEVFYSLLDVYYSNKCSSAKFALIKHSEDLFFTIKHRELEGFLTHTKASELRDHLRGSLDD